MKHGNNHIRSWLSLCGLLLAAICPLSVKAQVITWSKVTASATQEFQMQVQSVSGVIPTRPAHERDVSFLWKYNSAAASNACTAITGTSIGGTIQSFGSTPTGPKIGSVTLRCILITQPDGRHRGHMSFGVVGDAVYFYADAQFTFTIALTNDKNVPTTYTAYQNGAQIGQMQLQPGESRIVSFNSSDGATLTVTERPAQVVYIGGENVRVVGDTVTTVATGVTGVTGTVPGTPVTVTPATPRPGQAAADVIPGSGATQPVWDATAPGTGTSPTLSEGVFKQGVTAIVTAINNKPASATDMSGVHSRLDTANSKLESIKTNADLIKTAQAAMKTESDAEATTAKASRTALLSPGSIGADALSSAVSYSQSFVGAAAGAYGAYVPSGTVAPAQPGAADTAFIPITIAAGTVYQIPKNPFSSSGPFGGVMSSLAVVVRRLIAWGIVVAFFVWALGKVRAMVAAPFSVAPFGNSVGEAINSIKVVGSGGGLGYAAKLLVIAVLIPTILTMPLIVMAVLTAGLPWSELSSIYAAGPVGSTSGMMSSALAIADQVVPWVLLLSAPVWYFVTEFILFPSQLFWMFFMKVIPT